MSVAIDEARHQKPPFQVDRRGRGADKRPQSLVVANVHNPSIANRERLGGSMLVISSKYDAITVDTIGWPTRGDLRRGEPGG